MIRDLWLIGIGTGSPEHVTLQGIRAMCDAAVILVPHKGPGKDDLAELRYQIIRDSGTQAQVIPFDYPVRDPDLPYLERVNLWHDAIAKKWTDALSETACDGPVALLVWGDPALYDSTLRIAERLTPMPKLRVVPGITAIQALTSAFAIPLNRLNGTIQITTGRRLRDHGLSKTAETTLVMLDGEASFKSLQRSGLSIWWGAYLGSSDQVLIHGRLKDVTDHILETRAGLRARHGWIMDTYLLAQAVT